MSIRTDILIRYSLLLLLVVLIQLPVRAQIADSLLYEKAQLLEEIIFDQFDQHSYVLDNPRTHDDSIKTEYAQSLKKEILEKLKPCYQELISQFPNSNRYWAAVGGRAYTNYALGDTVAAKKDFIEILNSSDDDTRWLSRQHYEYKRNIAKVLADISIHYGDYAAAIGYLGLVKKYTIGRFCGNAIADEGNFIKSRYAKSYIGLHNYKAAYKLLIPEVLENPLAPDEELVNLAYTALLKTYSNETLSIEFERAFKHIKKKTFKDEYGTHHEYSIIFLNARIFLSPWRLYSERSQEKINSIIEQLHTQSTFYKLLHKS